MHNNSEQLSLFNHVIEEIKHKIKNGNLKKGQRLPPERVLAEDLGVSRSTIREAFRALEVIGLIKRVQGEGNFISDNFDYALAEPMSLMFALSGGNGKEIFELRSALEVEAAKIASRNSDHKDMTKLEQLCDIMEFSNDPIACVDADVAFHYEIAKLSKNNLIMSVLNGAAVIINMNIKQTREKILTDIEHLKVINEQHRDILEAVRTGDSDEARKVMMIHLRYVEKLYINSGL